MPDLEISAVPGFNWKILMRGTDISYDFRGDINVVREFADAVADGDTAALAKVLGEYVDIGTADAGAVINTLFSADVLWFQDTVVVLASTYDVPTLLECLVQTGEELVATLG